MVGPLLALLGATPAAAGAPVALDLRAVDPAPCPAFEERLVGEACASAHGAAAAGIVFVYSPIAGERWGDLVIAAPGLAADEISDGVICFADPPGPALRWFSVNTPTGDVVFRRSESGFARHEVGYAPGCEHD